MVATEEQKRKDAVSSSRFRYSPPALSVIHTELLLHLNIHTQTASHLLSCFLSIVKEY